MPRNVRFILPTCTAKPNYFHGPDGGAPHRNVGVKKAFHALYGYRTKLDCTYCLVQLLLKMPQWLPGSLRV